MHKELEKAFANLEQRKGLVLNRLESVEDELLHSRQSPESWSLVQVISHICESESASLDYCKKKIQAADKLPKASIFTSLRLFFLNAFLKSKLKYKAPKGLKSPSNDIDFHELCVRWFNVRSALKAFLESVPKKYLNRAIYKHPFAGRYTLKEMLLFFDAHMKHHEHQIDRIIKQLSLLDTHK